MGRALSLSAIAHLAFVFAFLMLAATRKPLVIPPVSRPVRLVAYLEPGASPGTKAPAVARPAAAEPQVPAPAAAKPKRAIAEPTRPTTPVTHSPAAASKVAPVAVPKIPAVEMPNTPPASKTTAEDRNNVTDAIRRTWVADRDKTPPPVTKVLPQIAKATISKPNVPEPAATSAGTATDRPQSPQPVSGGVWDPVLSPYTKNLSERIYARWSPPSEFFQKEEAPVALVSFRVDRAGRISGIALKEGSGSKRFDQSTLAAVRALAQAPPLPEQYHEETLDVVINFQIP